jgi:hypothetical protein
VKTLTIGKPGNAGKIFNCVKKDFISLTEVFLLPKSEDLTRGRSTVILNGYWLQIVSKGFWEYTEAILN